MKLDLKLPEKIAAAVNHLRKLFKNAKKIKTYSILEGNITYKTCPSTIPELQQFNVFMTDNISNQNEKSILDAEVIKLYNGGHYSTGVSTDGSLKIEQKNSLGFDYNERIGTIKE